MKTQQEHIFLFRLATIFLKYFLLFVSGLAITYVISSSFGLSNVTIMLLPLIGQLFERLAIVLLCLFAAAMIIESLVHK